MSWAFEQPNLRLDKQIKRQLGNKQTGPWPGRVSDGSSNIEHGEVLCWIDRLHGAPEDAVEYVIDSGATAQLLGRDIQRCSVNRCDERTSETGHQLQDQRALRPLALRARLAKRPLTLCSLPLKCMSPYDASSCCVWPIRVFSLALISGSRSRICAIKVF
jgi:hypothetical protein